VGTLSKSPSRSPERRSQGRGHERSGSKGYVPAPAMPPGLEAPTGPRERSRSDGRRQRTDTTSSSVSSHHYQNGTPKGPASNANVSTPQKKSIPAPIGTKMTPASTTDDLPEIDVTSPMTPGANTNPQEKKIRGLLKKIRAIDDLKMRLAGGEKLEDTQMKKITSEDLVRKELAALGYLG